MRKYNRIFLIVLDSLGIGAMADSEKFGDVGVNTFGHIWESQGGLEIPNLRRLGMGNLCGVTEDEAKGYARRLNEASNGKDTMTGHWEMMGIYTTKPAERSSAIRRRAERRSSMSWQSARSKTEN